MTPLNCDGLTPIPATHVAAVVTSLEMRNRPPLPDAPELPLAALGADLPRYRALFARIGTPWLWFSRRRMADAALAAILTDPAVEALALTRDGHDIGLVELDARVEGEVEIAFLGLVPEAVGRGIGRQLMGEALRRAWARPVSRVWVHTCTFDHPSAIGFYQASGFTPFARAIEVVPDPRLSGHLPREAAPHVPVLA
ncbi:MULTISPECIES: GNAT family N-acetyltransferase [unclassified Methylobacterium]|uniref:GNAT family N-acetyltransferase n=1 Tax=unclassified Methylobacterium TaxID=2615210 RepID=UPI000152C17A|nr:MULTISPECIES: GNAT family N-acetyltransferase [Methylobacterium]WFT77614.1 GNAT family N-acetyltransferase [Methylobacterium nodulans]